ncbi:hypothetical protein Taro_001350 [Colocasia esculenta]|uniref:Uncharacterized protein n=1 Tax=Colocasia esculenta TaxID=4460 RepID=A0A843THP4_COLES|nr:hypothetical protein [Colocasia esculenta]
MGWSCWSLVLSTAPLPRLVTGQQHTRPLCCVAPACPSLSTTPAPPATRTTPSPLVLGCRPSLLSLLSLSFSRRGPLNTAARGARQLLRVAEYVFPDPIPEFAEDEVDKFRSHMMEKLSKKDIFGSYVEEVVGICSGILSEFLHSEYGGPGTLLVVPFIDMADTINERGLPGGPQAARAAVVWAQKHVDKDWKEWTGSGNS